MIRFINFLFLLLLLNACNETGNNSSSSASSSSTTSSPSSTPNKLSIDSASIRKYFIDNYPSIERPHYSDVSVEFLPHAKGENSLGIYKIVHSESGKKQTYFAKLCRDSSEPDSYVRISNTINIFNELSQNANYPYFVKYKESFTIPRALIEEQFKEVVLKEARLGIKPSPKDIAVLVLEAAKGEDLDDFIKKAYATYSLNDLRKTFLKIGQSIGNLHSYQSTISIIENRKRIGGFVHGDLTFGNIFYDVASEKVSLIDYVGFQKFPMIEPLVSDFFSSGAATSLKPLIEACNSKEAALKIKTIFESFQEGLEEAFKNSPQKLAIIRFFVRIQGVPKYVKEFLEKYFTKDELPDLEAITKEYNEAVKI